jgi:hypothetical protein
MVQLHAITGGDEDNSLALVGGGPGLQRAAADFRLNYSTAMNVPVSVNSAPKTGVYL